MFIYFFYGEFIYLNFIRNQWRFLWDCLCNNKCFFCSFLCNHNLPWKARGLSQPNDFLYYICLFLYLNQTCLFFAKYNREFKRSNNCWFRNWWDICFLFVSCCKHFLGFYCISVFSTKRYCFLVSRAVTWFVFL